MTKSMQIYDEVETNKNELLNKRQSTVLKPKRDRNSNVLGKCKEKTTSLQFLAGKGCLFKAFHELSKDRASRWTQDLTEHGAKTC